MPLENLGSGLRRGDNVEVLWSTQLAKSLSGGVSGGFVPEGALVYLSLCFFVCRNLL